MAIYELLFLWGWQYIPVCSHGGESRVLFLGCSLRLICRLSGPDVTHTHTQCPANFLHLPGDQKKKRRRELVCVFVCVIYGVDGNWRPNQPCVTSPKVLLSYKQDGRVVEGGGASPLPYLCVDAPFSQSISSDDGWTCRRCRRHRRRPSVPSSSYSDCRAKSRATIVRLLLQVLRLCRESDSRGGPALDHMMDAPLTCFFHKK